MLLQYLIRSPQLIYSTKFFVLFFMYRVPQQRSSKIGNLFQFLFILFSLSYSRIIILSNRYLTKIHNIRTHLKYTLCFYYTQINMADDIVPNHFVRDCSPFMNSLASATFVFHTISSTICVSHSIINWLINFCLII